MCWNRGKAEHGISAKGGNSSGSGLGISGERRFLLTKDLAHRSRRIKEPNLDHAGIGEMICDRYPERFERRVTLCARDKSKEMSQSSFSSEVRGIGSTARQLCDAPRVRVGGLRSELRGERVPDRKVQKLP
mgnify:FL=1|jgi:hypothetical protein